MSVASNNTPAQPVQQDDPIHLTFSQLHQIDRFCIKYLRRLDKDGRVAFNFESITSQTGVPQETFLTFNTERRRAWRSAGYFWQGDSNLNLSSGPVLKISESTEAPITLTFDQLHRLGFIYEDRYEKDNRKFPCYAEKKQNVENLETLKLSSQDMFTFFLTRLKTFRKLKLDEETELEEQEKEFNETNAQLKLANDSVKAKDLEIEELKKTVETITSEKNGIQEELCSEKDKHAETKAQLKLASDSVKAKDLEIEKETIKQLQMKNVNNCQLSWTEKSDHTKTETILKTKDLEIESLKKKIERITIEKNGLHEDLCSEEVKHAETRKGLHSAYVFNAKVLENLNKTIKDMKDSEEKKVSDLENKLQEKQNELNKTVKLYWNLEKIITEERCEALMEKKYGAEKKEMEKTIQEMVEMLKTQNDMFDKMENDIYN